MFSLAPAAGTRGTWTAFSRVWRAEVSGKLTVYLQQQSTDYASYFAEVALQKEPTAGAWTVSPVEEWTAVRALLYRQSYMGKDAIVVKDGGAWSHAYREMQVYATAPVRPLPPRGRRRGVGGVQGGRVDVLADGLDVLGGGGRVRCGRDGDVVLAIAGGLSGRIPADVLLEGRCAAADAAARLAGAVA